MLFDWVLLILGLAFLVLGGEGLVRGAAALAHRNRVSPLLVGLTVVSFGTSAPELAVNIDAAWRGSGDISFGNIVGSNMANIGLIAALGAMLRPIHIHSAMLLREFPMMLLATAAFVVLLGDPVLTDRPVAELDRSDGVLLLLFFCAFLYYTFHELRSQRSGNGDEVPAKQGPRTVMCLALIGVGLVSLLVGAEITVDAATALAEGLGVPKVWIGLTLIAFGTSLPELAATLVAALRGYSDLALGNVVGSNIFNLLLVGGASAGVRPVPLPKGGADDLAALCLLSLLLWATGATGQRSLLRMEGTLLLSVYVAYLVWRSMRL